MLHGKSNRMIEVVVSISFCSRINDKKYILFQKILQPFTHVLKASCKGIPAKLFQSFNYWLKIPADKLSEMQDVFQMFHFGGFL